MKRCAGACAMALVMAVSSRDGRTTEDAGHLVELQEPRNHRQTILYRRSH